MRLTDLEPRWIAADGRPDGILAFRCPHCRQTWVTVTRRHMPTKEQWAAWATVWPDADDRRDIMGCEPGAQWAIEGGPGFDSITITPSLDGSKAGHWHGFVTAGVIVGGVP